jgi:hypothetical protein
MLILKCKDTAFSPNRIGWQRFSLKKMMSTFVQQSNCGNFAGAWGIG